MLYLLWLWFCFIGHRNRRETKSFLRVWLMDSFTPLCGSSVRSTSAKYAASRVRYSSPVTFWSTTILPRSLIQKWPLSVTDERMSTKRWYTAWEAAQEKRRYKGLLTTSEIFWKVLEDRKTLMERHKKKTKKKKKKKKKTCVILSLCEANIIITLFQEDNIFGTNASLTYGPQFTKVDT